MDQTAADLDAFVSGEEEWDWPADDEALDALDAPRDADQANRMLRGLRRVQGELDEIAAVADAERARIMAWQLDRSFGLTRRVEALQSVLEGYARSVIPGRKAKTLDYPNGKLSLRSPGVPRLEVTDAEAFIAWASTRDDKDQLLRTKVEVAAGEVKKLLTPGTVTQAGEDEQVHKAMLDDEVVPGVALVVATRDSFSVQVKP